MALHSVAMVRSLFVLKNERPRGEVLESERATVEREREARSACSAVLRRDPVAGDGRRRSSEVEGGSASGDWPWARGTATRLGSGGLRARLLGEAGAWIEEE